MTHNILVTGGSGYLGGTLLARWKDANLPAHGNLYALARTDDQAEAVRQQYGASPLSFDVKDEAAVRATLVDHEISVVYFLIDAFYSTSQVLFIRALAEVKERTGREVHFLHTTGAKIFSSHAGAPTDRQLLDTDPELYDIQKSQTAPAIKALDTATNTNCVIIDEGEKYGVRTYIFTPCIVYGKGEGFGNPISIQTVSIVKAAKAAKYVYRLADDRPTWPVCHVIDNTNLYLELLHKILTNDNPSHGKNGYYLAAAGSVAWDDLYAAVAVALAKRKVVEDEKVALATEENLATMGSVLLGGKEWVSFHLGGRCTFTAKRGNQELGWKPLYKPGHILEDADNEVELILQNLED